MNHKLNTPQSSAHIQYQRCDIFAQKWLDWYAWKNHQRKKKETDTEY